MKTTIEIDEELFRRSKAEAALRGESLKDFFSAALREYLGGLDPSDGRSGWRKVFGTAEPGLVRQVDIAVSQDLERVDPEEWK